MSGPFNVKSPATGKTVYAVDGSGNSIQDGYVLAGSGLILPATAAPTPAPGSIALYNNNGALTYTGVDGQAVNQAVSGTLNVTGQTTLGDLLTINSSNVAGALHIVQSVTTTNNPGTISQQESASTNGAYGVFVSGEAHGRWTLVADGSMKWGPGAASQDTFLQRSGVNALSTNGNLQIGAAADLGDNGAGELKLATVTTEATSNPVGGVLLYANSAGHLKWRNPNGVNPVLGGSLSTVTATNTIANSAALTALQAFTVPANDPIQGSAYRVKGFGTYSVTGTPTLTFALYWGGIGGTLIAAVPAITAGSGVTNVPFAYEMTVSFRSSTSCTADIELKLGTSATTDAASLFVATPTAPTTVVTNVNSDLTVGFTWSAASASNTISLLGGTIELVR